MPVFIIYVVSMLLLCSGDVEINPGPVYTVCPNCNIQVHIISFLENVEGYQLDVQLVQLKMQGLTVTYMHECAIWRDYINQLHLVLTM